MSINCFAMDSFLFFQAGRTQGSSSVDARCSAEEPLLSALIKVGGIKRQAPDPTTPGEEGSKLEGLAPSPCRWDPRLCPPLPPTGAAARV